MRIARVTPVSVGYPDPNDDGNTRYLTLCRIDAADGTVGWGEAITMWPEACRATEALIHGLSPLVEGRDALQNLDIWRRLKAHTWWYGHQGIASFALSAIDIALWDLKGKALGLPLTDLLGGAHHARLPVVASTHAFLPTLEAEAERHGDYARAGYRGIKIGLGKRGQARLGHELARDVEFMRLLREAVGGDVPIMFDRDHGLGWDVARAIATIRAWEEHGLHWIEEPLEPSDVDGLAQLRRHVTTLIAGGEREWNADGFRRVIGTGTLDVVGVDPGRSEGVTGFLAVAALAEAASIWVNAHAFSSAIVTAASLAVSLTTPRCRSLELKPMENPMQHELVEDPIDHQDGYVVARRGPGLGVTVNDAVVEKYRLR